MKDTVVTKVTAHKCKLAIPSAEVHSCFLLRTGSSMRTYIYDLN